MSASLRLVSRLFACLMCFAPVVVHAEPSGFGGISVLDAQGNAYELVALSSEVEYQVSGLVGEASIHQRFTNTSPGFIDAQYLLPLPEHAAVHDLQLHIGDRSIAGEIREKEQARREYVEAAASGRRASLVETERANLFRTAVANVGPGETIDVQVSWWQPIAFRDGRFALTLPLTYTPRFVPADVGADAAAAGAVAPAGHAHADDVHSATAPQVSVKIALDAGVDIENLTSSSHRLKTTGNGSHRDIELADGSVPADRDFVLEWTPRLGATPASSVLVEQWNGESYALAMLLPPSQVAAPLPRELILVIDTSGSMQGASINQAKAAMQQALQSLTPRDRFNVIQFNSIVEPLFDDAVAVNDDNLARASRWIDALRATGGTEMGMALQRSLAGSAPPGFVRQVVFATDGAVDDAPGLYSTIDTNLGESRLFTIGIGSAPNAHFIERAAELGRGTFVVVRRIEDVGTEMRTLFAKLDSPALRDLALNWPTGAESYPQRLPDLYAGEPLIVVARLGGATGQLEVNGTMRDAPWAARLQLDNAAPATGIARLWAQRKAAELQQRLNDHPEEKTLRQAIVALAVEHHIVTPYTSLVAIDRTPVVPIDAQVNAVRIANGVPAGSLGYAQTATPATLETLLGLLLLTIALIVACAPRVRRACASQ